MSEYIITDEQIAENRRLHGKKLLVMPVIVRCRDCKHFDIPDWDNTLAENYGEPPMFCMQLSMNEWRMDGDRRVADTTFLEVEPDCFCKWGERREP